ncbi:MAG TPA: EamA family transporter [Brevundimonas sp.]
MTSIAGEPNALTLPNLPQSNISRPFWRRPTAGTLAILGVVICALIWGTTWFAITFQLGTVDPTASIVWRFGLASVILFAVCLVMRSPIRLTRAQHLAAAGQGVFAFALSYTFVYKAEGLISSGVVAVAFASMALMNLILFRLVEKQTAARTVWIGAGLGALGVAVLSGGELFSARLGPDVGLGIALALAAAAVSTLANWFAWRGQRAGSQVIPATAWAMAYGAGLVVLFGLATGVHWSISLTPGYLGSLLYLAVLGSVVAFVIYFTVARSHGYTLASYIGALVPLIALTVSVLFEGARFGVSAFAGVALVIAGQIMLTRTPKAPAA